MPYRRRDATLRDDERAAAAPTDLHCRIECPARRGRPLAQCACKRTGPGREIAETDTHRVLTYRIALGQAFDRFSGILQIEARNQRIGLEKTTRHQDAGREKIRFHFLDIHTK